MTRTPATLTGAVLSATLLILLVVPLVALVLSTSVADLQVGLTGPLFAPALWLSLRTTAVTLGLTVLLGTPLAWWLATTRHRWARGIELMVELPIVIPPAVIGVALLETFGRRGLFGPLLELAGIGIAFTEVAVVLAQLVVAAPFFVLAAANAFRKVDVDLLIVARTLGASPTAAFTRIAVPTALPGLIVGASLAWARALGEFGATFLFAGNRTGVTQTLPLAIYSALQSDVRTAIALSLVLAGSGALLLLGLRGTPAVWTRLVSR